MPTADYFGIKDKVKTLQPPAGMEAVHQDGYSWAKAGATFKKSTLISADDWNMVIGNFRGLAIAGVDLSDIPATSPMLLREMILRRIAADIPAGVATQIPALADELATNADLLALLAQAGAGVPTIDGPLSAATVSSNHLYINLGTKLLRRVDKEHPGLGANVVLDPSFDIGLSPAGPWVASGGGFTGSSGTLYRTSQAIAGTAAQAGNEAQVTPGTYFFRLGIVSISGGSGIRVLGEGNVVSPWYTSPGEKTGFVTTIDAVTAELALQVSALTSVEISYMYFHRIPAGSIQDATGAWWAPLPGAANADAIVSLEDAFAAAAARETIILQDDARGGSFWKNTADVSAKLLVRSLTTSAINGITDVLTFGAEHYLANGTAVCVLSAVNGLAANTLYYVRRENDLSIILYDAWEKAIDPTGHTRINLTGTTATTLYVHRDPVKAVYVTQPSDIIGKYGAWQRIGSGNTIWSRYFGHSPANTAAANDRALHAAAQWSGNVMIGAGAYAHGKVLQHYGNLSLQPRGKNTTFLAWLGGVAGGIDWHVTSDRTTALSVAHVTFISDAAGLYTAISANGSNRTVDQIGGGFRDMVNIHDCGFSGPDGPSTGGWNMAIRATECVHVRATKNTGCGAIGAGGEADIISGSLVYIDCAAVTASVAFVSENIAYYFDKAYRYANLEGVQTERNLAVAVNWGLWATDILHAGENPHLSIRDNHFNANKGGIFVENWQQVFANDNAIYNRSGATGVDVGGGNFEFKHIELKGCASSNVSDNFLIKNEAAVGVTMIGVDLTGDSKFNRIKGNEGVAVERFIRFGASTSFNAAFANYFRPNNVTDVFYTNLAPAANDNRCGPRMWKAKNAALVSPANGAFTNLATLAIGGLVGSEVLHVSATASVVRADAGDTILRVIRTSGTAAVTWFDDLAEIRAGAYLGGGNPTGVNIPSLPLCGTGVVGQTVGLGGTINLELQVNPAGTGAASVAANGAQIIVVELAA